MFKYIFGLLFALIMISSCEKDNFKCKKSKTDDLFEAVALERKQRQQQPRPTTVPNYTKIKGYGKISKTTGRPRTNIVSGHWRRTTKGYTYVRPYARS